MKKLAYEHKTQQTQALLLNTFLDLLAEKDFEKITVRDITERAQINRGTFYRHFQDKMDLLEKKEREIYAGLEDLYSSLTNKHTFLATDEFGIPKSDLVLLLTYLYSHRRFMTLMLGANGDLSFEHDLMDLMYTISEQKLAQSTFNTQSHHYKVVMHYQIAALLGVIRYWFIEEAGASTPEQVAEEIYQINRAGVWKNLRMID